MRAPSDLPRRPRRLTRGRIWIIVAVVALFVLITSLRSIAGFYTDYLWFKELHFSGVFTSILGVKIGLAVVFTGLFFLLMWSNLTVADRLAPRFRPIGPEDELVQRYREFVGPHAGKVRVGVSLLIALFAGLGTRSQWNNWILFRNGASFGAKDAQFHKDLGFFVFQLPFIKFVVNWFFVAIIITAVVTILAHYLNGGIRLQAQGQRVTPQVKAHISVLLGALALVKAISYWFERYELDLSKSHVVNGATYTSVHADLPAKSLLILIAIVAAGLFIYNIFRKGWFLPGIAVALWGLVWILVGAVYPAIIQGVTVKPSELAKERVYIGRNIAATRSAFGLGNINVVPYNYVPNLTPQDLDPNGPNAATISNIRLWDPKFVGDTYTKEQEIRQYYRFNALGVDRYNFNGQTTETLSAVRELNPSDLPSSSWVNTHLAFTHGEGAVLSPVNAATADGKPVFAIQDVPPSTTSGSGAPTLNQPAVYYGLNVPGYAVVNTQQHEIDYQRPDGTNVETRYSGTGGVPIGGRLSFRRIALALRFGDPNMLLSGLLNSSSRAMYVRSIGDRVRKAAPFLKYDADPYPVLSGNHIVWVQDAYTVTSRYPYSQGANLDRVDPSSGLSSGFNYVRNSVKAVIDAYDGSVKFYAMDQTDPILRTYEKAFPQLFTPKTEMPSDLQQHLRYPEDLFMVQTNMYGRYHITDPDGFYSAGDAWAISQDPGSGSPTAIQQTQTTNAQGQIISTRRARMDPEYLLLHMPDDKGQGVSFVQLQPFVAASNSDKQQNLTAFMTAESDLDNYGKLTVFTTPRGAPIDGPALINATISASPGISEEISLLNQNGSSVKLGNVLVIPVNDSLLYVQPLYVQSAQNPVPELRKVIVVNGNQAAMQDTLAAALKALVPGSNVQTQEQNPAGPSGTTPTTQPGQPGTTTPTTQPPAGLAALVSQELQDFANAQAALQRGDLATYQKDINAANDIAKQLGAKVNATPPTTAGGGATTTTAPPSPTTTGPPGQSTTTVTG
jgi:uncharacterized membrane protein (UPF0182 family)